MGSPDVEKQQEQLEYTLVEGAGRLGHRVERIGQRAVASRKVLTNFYLVGLPPDYCRRRPIGLQGPRTVLCELGSVPTNLQTSQTRQEPHWQAFCQRKSDFSIQSQKKPASQRAHRKKIGYPISPLTKSVVKKKPQNMMKKKLSTRGPPRLSNAWRRLVIY